MTIEIDETCDSRGGVSVFVISVVEMTFLL